MWLGGVRVVLMTDRKVMGDGVVAFGDVIARAVRAVPVGAAMVLVREADPALVHAAMASGAPVVVEKHVSVALETGAAGVVISGSMRSVMDVRMGAPAGFVVGQSRSAGEAIVAPTAARAHSSDRIDAALAEYAEMIRKKPVDVRVWLKVGDLHAKKGATQEALASYHKVADFYREQGFMLKAVAVYKQMLKLDPRADGVRPQLAALYAQLGLHDDAVLFANEPPAGPAPSPHPDFVLLGPIFNPAVVRDARAAIAASGHRIRLAAYGGISPAQAREAGADAVTFTAWTGDPSELLPSQH
jgi:hypothetical protein